MATQQAQPVSFRGVELETALRARSDSDKAQLGAVAKRDLERYYELLRRELRGITFTPAEAMLLCDAANGTLWESSAIPFLWAEIADAIALQGLDKKWQVDGLVLGAKLRALNVGQAHAVVDAVERFWVTGADSTDERLRAVGLVR